ncbi:ribonuclease domain-containing protein [Rhodanobacter sp. MP1X3]|uniref:ribonuclease domain-containing protein n=1 Tax=Rhodanobacter sp. MP1X3 TaxID=2723086 RepID=UPI00160E8BB8|nr:ribonuclease domain-containing protein [Rhodanobacter sp. MP1X3]MBB6243753.1 guanyl-specific ribonuclease Sa [Rhodanobacter sp. MP1X3]
MRQFKPLILLLVLVAAAAIWSGHGASPNGAVGSAATTGSNNTSASLPSFLPAEARATLDRIASAGPFTHRQDGVVFGNYENLLPSQPRGYYHEYTVETPGADTRGARRIITGGTPPDIYYYTDDHYRSFRAFKVNR